MSLHCVGVCVGSLLVYFGLVWFGLVIPIQHRSPVGANFISAESNGVVPSPTLPHSDSTVSFMAEAGRTFPFSSYLLVPLARKRQGRSACVPPTRGSS